MQKTLKSFATILSVGVLSVLGQGFVAGMAQAQTGNSISISSSKLDPTPTNNGGFAADSTSPGTNTVTVSSSQLDSNPTNNVSGAALSAVNIPPTANNLSDTTTTAGGSGTFAASAIGTDTDGTIASASVATCSNGGSAASDGNTPPGITYTMPAAGQTTTCSFTVTDNDGDTSSAAATITLTSPAALDPCDLVGNPSGDCDGDSDPNSSDPSDNNPCVDSVAGYTAQQQTMCVDLSVTKTFDGTGTSNCAGALSEWTVTVSNAAGLAMATNVVVTDTPTRGTVSSVSGNGFVCSNVSTGATGSCTIPSIASGASASVTVCSQ